MINKITVLGLGFIAMLAYVETGSASDIINEMEKEYAKAYAPCEECTIGHKAVGRSKDCAAKCMKAKKLRMKIDKMKKEAAQPATAPKTE